VTVITGEPGVGKTTLIIGELGEAGFDLSLTGFDEFELTPTLVFLLYQKGRNSRIFQAQDG
jgi:nucleoside-triphosphatase THEP1